jgi:hypothetical protein
MAIEKGLYAAPLGMEQAAEQETPMEIQIEDPEAVDINIGDLSIHMEPAGEDKDEFSKNLAEDLDERVLTSLAADLTADFDADLTSRKDWMQTYVDGLELLGMKLEERSEPWEGACGVYHPLMSEALVKFQAETMMETFPAAGPVKTQIIGKETPEKKESAARVQEDMNYQLTELMPEYRPEHERMLWGLGLSGNAFKKVYFDPSLQRQVSIFVPAEDLVVPYGASNLQTAERITHVMRKTENELLKLQAAGFYRDVYLGEPSNMLDEVEKKIAEKMGFRATSDDRFKLLEMQVELDLPGYEHKDDSGTPTGIALPYIVTIEKGTNNVLAIRRNWQPNDDTYAKRNHFVHYGYIPGFGFYCFGLIHLIGAFAKSGTSILRQLVDSGTLANLPGGFKTRGFKTKGDDTPIAPGEFRDVDIPSGTMRDNILPLPYKEPSQTLLALMNQIIDEGRRFAAAADLQVSDMSANSPVGTTLAILERTLKVMSAVQARIHYSMKQELKLLKEIIADYAPTEYSYDPNTGSPKARQSDYANVNVIPVSDPNAATMSQKVVQYQAVLQLAQSAPQLYNLPLLHRQMIEILGVKNADKLVPMEEDKKPEDPITENMNLINMKPVKAFLYQDHQAHIQVHMAAMQDPKILQLMQTNPMAQQIQAAAMAHVNEHIAYEYRKQMEQRMGIPLPPEKLIEDQGIPPEIESQISQMAAQAGQQLLQQNQQQAAQQQAQQQAQDPLVQLQQQELQIKQQELQRKATKDKIDAAAKADQLEIEKERIASQERIAGLQVGAKTAGDKAKLQADLHTKGLQIGTQVGKDKAQMAIDAAKHADSLNLQHKQARQQHAHNMHQLSLQEQQMLQAQQAQQNKPINEGE